MSNTRPLTPVRISRCLQRPRLVFHSVSRVYRRVNFPLLQICAAHRYWAFARAACARRSNAHFRSYYILSEMDRRYSRTARAAERDRLKRGSKRNRRRGKISFFIGQGRKRGWGCLDALARAWVFGMSCQSSCSKKFHLL